MKLLFKFFFLFNGIIFLSGFSLFSYELPECNADEVKDTIRQLVNEVGETFIDLSNIQEKGYNKAKQIRLCGAELASTAGSEYVEYHIKWQNKAQGTFWVTFVE